MPKKAVATFFLLAFIGAALFVYFTFPRTKDEIPKSNNQHPYPSAPVEPDPNSNPSPNVPSPNPVPVPETAPRPDAPKVPPGPKLTVMAWASGADAQRLDALATAFSAATGRAASLSINSDEASYRRDLAQAMLTDSPPDVCLVAARDFSGLDPARDLADATPQTGSAPRSLAAFTVDGHIKAAPAEFSVAVLFYNPSYFDQAGIGYPDRHWNWDILEADARALDSLKLKDPNGRPAYPLELPANFDFWNILCTQAGHPALDQGTWHLADHDTKESQMRALDFIHEIFQGLTVTAPLPKKGQPTGELFLQQRAALLIAPSSLTAAPTTFKYAFTLLPADMERASMAQVNGWAVTARSDKTEAARALAAYLAFQSIHTGWTSIRKPADAASPAGICYEALGQSLVPRIEPKTARMAQFLDQQINLLARNANADTGAFYDRIQTEFQGDMTAPGISGEIPHAAGIKPAPKLDPEMRGM